MFTVICLLEKSKVAQAGIIHNSLKKLKLIAIMNYYFKQELHKLLWFNDNDRDNINDSILDN